MPPTNKPWLISTPAELAADAYATAQFSVAWLRAHPFPGVDAGIEPKSEWLANIHKCYEAELEESFFMTSAPEASEVVAQTLMEAAPNVINLQMVTPRSELDEVEITAEQEAIFAANLKDFSVPGYSYDGEAKFDAYKKWILSNQQGDEVIFAVIPCNKTDKVSDKTSAFLETCGLRENYRSVRLVDMQTLSQACWQWGFQKHVGENVYYNKGGMTTVPLLLSLTAKSSDKTSAKAAAFQKEVLAAEESTKNTANPQTFFYVEKKGKKSNEGDGATADNMHVVWVPDTFKSHKERASRHLDWGEGETHQIQKRLEKGNTDTGNIKIEIFQAELKYAKSKKLSLKEQFSATLALTVAAGSDTFWMNDNEFPEELAKSVKALATVWRTTLLPKTDEELGIVAPTGNPGTTSSRDGLYEILSIMGKQFTDASEYVKVGKWNFKPKVPRAIGNTGQKQPKKKKQKKGGGRGTDKSKYLPFLLGK